MYYFSFSPWVTQHPRWRRKMMKRRKRGIVPALALPVLAAQRTRESPEARTRIKERRKGNVCYVTR